MPSPRTAPVLIVDDNEVQSYALKRLVEKHGFQAVQATNGSQGWNRAGNRPCLILLDINLPDISGWQLCKNLLANPETADIPVILISALDRSELAVQMAKNVGAKAFLTYPVEENLLLTTMSRALETPSR